MKKYLVLIGLMSVLAMTAGCLCKHRRPSPPPCPTGCPTPGCPPGGGVPVVPPGAFPGQGVVPPPASFPQPAPIGVAPGSPPPPPPFNPGVSNAPPAPHQHMQYRWNPAPQQNSSPSLGSPLPSAPERFEMPPNSTQNDVDRTRIAGVQLLGPEPVGDLSEPRASLYPPAGSVQPAAPRLKIPAQSLPVGIPQFSSAGDGVATGLRPSLDDGLDWLQANNYRTVLRLRAPGDSDSPDRQEIEKRGMRYLTLEISPETLSRDAVETFSGVVANADNRPLFVYDRDGSLAGGLWYLHFRLTDRLTDDQARVRSAALGFRPDQEPSHQQMWRAIQQLP